MIPSDAAELEAGDREGAGIDVLAADGIFCTNIETGKDSAVAARMSVSAGLRMGTPKLRGPH
jgi:hypothetical protein